MKTILAWVAPVLLLVFTYMATYSETNSEQLAWTCASICTLIITLQNNEIGRDFGLRK